MRPPLPVQPIAWIDAPDGGHWGTPDALGVPLDDRGLRLADGIFETVLVEGGRPQLLAEHLLRWRTSAELLGMAAPPGDSDLAPLIATALERAGFDASGTFGAEPGRRRETCSALRLNWSRGSMAPGCGGIDLPPPGAPPPHPRFWLELRPAVPRFDPVRVIVSRTERRAAGSLLNRCKTFAYGAAIQAKREARIAGADDALLESTAGGLSCGTTANLLVRRSGRWLTPPLASGCLPGVMRGRALALGVVEEACLAPEDLSRGEGVLLINSLGCRPVEALEGERLEAATEPEAFWRSLLGAPGPAALG